MPKQLPSASVSRKQKKSKGPRWAPHVRHHQQPSIPCLHTCHAFLDLLRHLISSAVAHRIESLNRSMVETMH
jgi:hypothetical protein